MRCFPASTLLLAALVAGFTSCDRRSEKPAENVPRLPFSGAPLPTGSFTMVSAHGDTLRFRISSAEGGARLARYRHLRAGMDSLVALIDPDTKAPIASFQRRHLEAGSVTAQVLYGRGFEGQARLLLATPEGRREDNIRTPPPVLDQSQLPLTLTALPFTNTDSLSFNYVAPFEGRALAARLMISADTLDTAQGSRPAWRLKLLVSGLDERYWVDAEPPHDLLRIEEVTRNETWTRS